MMNKNSENACFCTKLNPLALAFAAGIVWGLGMLLLGLIAMHSTLGHPWIPLVASVYKGFAATTVGSFIGLLWGFVEGFVGGLIFAWIYNCCVCCKMCRSLGMCKKEDMGKDKYGR
jgi:hypothetical protein